jgi:hypothetical protein
VGHGRKVSASIVKEMLEEVAEVARLQVKPKTLLNL